MEVEEVEAPSTSVGEGEQQDAQLQLAHALFRLREATGSDLADAKAGVLSTIEAGAMAPLYEALCTECGWMVEDAKLAGMKAANEKELAALEARIEDAKENLGESEVREGLLAKSLFFVKIGDKAKALEAFEVTEKQTVAVGLKMDVQFHVLRLGMFHSDVPLMKQSIAKIKELLASPGGADWERKNRLKVYEAVFLMSNRDFSGAAKLFLESLSTFTSYELCSYSTFIFYTVITSIVALDRVTLKAKVVDAPEVLTVIDAIPNLTPMLNGLHECDYTRFFAAFSQVIDQVKSDRHLSVHHRYFMRELRIKAYAQFLESYKSVTLQNMALAFGVSSDFLDAELSNFIAGGRLNCKIDKVEGVLATTRPDVKNALYMDTVKKGDLLLNRVQKLAASSIIDASTHENHGHQKDSPLDK
eukprot:CAMPEP_0170142468 /NCGR_PEP_ID=MMETSP0033_2-20121228/7647_1 /TAXON_ID=195969 /ORGANISM="Dolichomastix tenuilepis, Strain CCMP3274" /LENGTH=415 /DNA_ID=CAMNT_0010378797 /DNA_START=56 /DNA_END=1304 /DNA_ORIENTATION=+